MRKLCVFLVLITCSALFAQDDKKNEVGLLLGGTVTPSASTQAGAPVDYSSDISFEANYARRLVATRSRTLFLEFPLVASPSTKTTSTDQAIAREYAQFFLTPSLRLDLSRNRVISPWVSFGYGFGWFQNSEQLLNGTANTLGERNTFHNTLQWGAGADFKTPLKLKLPIGLRAEVRDFYTFGNPDLVSPLRDKNQHNLAFAGGIVLKF